MNLEHCPELLLTPSTMNSAMPSALAWEDRLPEGWPMDRGSCPQELPLNFAGRALLPSTSLHRRTTRPPEVACGASSLMLKSLL